ncbi:MAG: transglutaminase domain-containing protein [Dehalococcoidia bacterium]
MFQSVGKKLVIRCWQVIRQICLGSNLLGWLGVGFGFLTSVIAIGSIEHAHWITPQPSLITVLGLATAVGIILANTHISGKIAVPIMLLIGLVVTAWQAARPFAPAQEMSSLQLWWHTISASHPADSPLYFATGLTLISWLVGFVSAWFILRKRSAWPPVILGMVVLLVNLSNLPRDMYYFFPLYCLSAILTIAAVSLAKKGDILIQWKEKSVRRGTALFSVALLSIAAVTVGAAYLMPLPNLNGMSMKIDATSFYFEHIEGRWFDIFRNVYPKWEVVVSRHQERLLFTDPIERSNEVRFLVDAEDSDYWRTRSYDVYESWGWTSTIGFEQSLPPGEPITYHAVSPESKALTYVVEYRLKTDIVLSSGRIVSVNIPVKLQTPLPLSEGFEDITAIVGTQTIGPYESCKVVTNFTIATPEELTRSGEEYPDWVTSHYLQLPDSLPERVRELSENITHDAQTPYDKAIAIKDYLAKFEYDQTVQAPPKGSDGVDYFLFSTERGVCTNFASAMAVMLRSVGVPARLACGYFRGELDEVTGNYIIRGRNSHAWVEVYFPKYGWIIFEPSPTRLQATTESTSGENMTSDEGYNLFFSNSEELPFWMLGDESLGTKDTGQTSPLPYVFKFLGVASLLAIVVFATRQFFDRRVNQLKWVKTASDAYNRMRYLAGEGDLGAFDHETPLEFSRRLIAYLPEQEENVNSVVQAFVTVKYSPRKELDERSIVWLQKAWVRLCPSLVKCIPFPRRWTLLRSLRRPR